MSSPPQKKTSLLGSQGAEGKEEERANGKGKREQTGSIGVGKEGRGGRRVARRLGSGTQGITTRFRGHTVEEFPALAQLSAWEGTGKERSGKGL